MRAGLVRYGQVLRQGHAARPFAAAFVARLPTSMTPLAILLLVRQVHGTYTFAGAVAGAFAVGTAVGGPWWGSRLDRLGQTRVVLLTSLSSAALLVGVAALAVQDRHPVPLLATALAAGSTFPPLSPAMRATWRLTVDDPGLRQVAFALDAVAVETMFVGGPLLVSLLLSVGHPAVPLAATATLLALGGVTYSLTAAVRAHRPVTTDRGSTGGDRVTASVLGTPGVLAVLAVSAAISIGFGHIDTSMAATAREVLHDPARIGLLFTAIAGGSASGGLIYGTLRAASAEHRRLPVALALFAVALVPLSLLLAFGRPPLWSLMALLFLAGLTISPALIMCQNLMDGLTSPAQGGEAQGWLSTAGTTGTAAGTAVAGGLVDRVGPGWTFAAAAVAVTGAGVIAAAHSDRWNRPAARDEPAGRAGSSPSRLAAE
jgi:MFS family permease